MDKNHVSIKNWKDKIKIEIIIRNNCCKELKGIIAFDGMFNDRKEVVCRNIKSIQNKINDMYKHG